MPTFAHLDSREFSRALLDIKTATRRSSTEVLKQEGRLFIQDVVKFTPPFTGSGGTGSLGSHRKVGENATTRDINRSFSVLENLEITTIDRFRKMIDAGNFEGLRIALERSGIRAASVMREADSSIHSNTRDGRGRVRRGGHGNWIVDADSIKRFIKDKIKHVGKAKAGWSVAAVGLGLKLPKWITRHASPGLYIPPTGHGDSQSLTVGNLVDYIQASGSELRIISRAMARRTNSLRKRLERVLKSNWAKSQGRST